MLSHRLVRLTYCQLRHFSVQKQNKSEEKKGFQPHGKATKDWIGPPDKESNLRPIRFFIPKDESKNAEFYRERRMETQDWNQEFWANHNTKFYQLKEDFVKKKIEEKKQKAKESGQEEDDILSAEEMSMFYKKFLDDNYKSHLAYNKEWYQRNLRLLWLAFKDNFEKLRKKNKK